MQMTASYESYPPLGPLPCLSHFPKNHRAAGNGTSNCADLRLRLSSISAAAAPAAGAVYTVGQLTPSPAITCVLISRLALRLASFQIGHMPHGVLKFLCGK